MGRRCYLHVVAHGMPGQAHMALHCSDHVNFAVADFLPHRGLSDVEWLGSVERYFVEIKDIPRLGQRIKCFILTCTYAGTKAKVGGQGWVGGGS